MIRAGVTALSETPAGDISHEHVLVVHRSKQMPSETDPLLPSGSSAPEVTGYGFSEPSKAQSWNARSQPRSDAGLDEDDTDDRQGPRDLTDRGASPLRTLIALFTTVVGLALVITLFVPGALDIPWHNRKDDTAATNRDRAMKILSNTPLIGA